jgi:general secretion pathway protein D
VGQSLVIVELKELGDLNPMFESATVKLEYLDPVQLAEAAGLLASPQGKVKAVAPAKSLMIVDFPDRVARIRELIREWDRPDAETIAAGADAGGAARDEGPLDVALFRPQYVSASSLLPVVETVLSGEGKVAAMEPDNRLVVTDHQTRLLLARQIVEQADVPRRQVRITALIYDLSVEDIERLGINWNQATKWRHDDQNVPNSVFQIDSLLAVPVSAGTPDMSMTFMNLSRYFDITAVARALQEAKDSRLLADPNVTVLNHEKAEMITVTEIPYQELTQTTAGGQIGTTSFREAGIKLLVTPHIADDGTIRMEVTPSFSRLAGFTPGEQAQPIIDRREASTSVTVLDRQVLVIGGLRTRNDTGNFNGLPYLKDISAFHLGALFRARDTEIRESELVVFIMPEIISSAHVGSCREAAAVDSGRTLLERVPVASTLPPPERPIPYCPPTPIGGYRPSNVPYPVDEFSGVVIPLPPTTGPPPPLLEETEEAAKLPSKARDPLRLGYQQRFRASGTLFQTD